jgi:carbonic anhydrase/acetyltransferase-like protein (isoleucine patch superfamily)
LVKSDEIIPKNSLVVGVPAKVVKQDEKFKEIIMKNAKTYREISKEYLNGEYYFYNG